MSKPRSGARALALAAMLALGASCGGTTGSSTPEGHTVSEEGVMHRPGLHDPLTSCVGCHGASLQGGQGPSCTTCHGVVW